MSWGEIAARVLLAPLGAYVFSGAAGALLKLIPNRHPGAVLVSRTAALITTIVLFFLRRVWDQDGARMWLAVWFVVCLCTPFLYWREVDLVRYLHDYNRKFERVNQSLSSKGVRLSIDDTQNLAERPDKNEILFAVIGGALWFLAAQYFP